MQSLIKGGVPLEEARNMCSVQMVNAAKVGNLLFRSVALFSGETMANKMNKT